MVLRLKKRKEKSNPDQRCLEIRNECRESREPVLQADAKFWIPNKVIWEQVELQGMDDLQVENDDGVDWNESEDEDQSGDMVEREWNEVGYVGRWDWRESRSRLDDIRRWADGNKWLINLMISNGSEMDWGDDMLFVIQEGWLFVRDGWWMSEVYPTKL